jgi:Rieske Fe-S protein
MAFVSALPVASARPFSGAAVTCSAPVSTSAAAAPVRMAAEGGMVPDMAKRNTMNLLLVGATTVAAGSMAVPFGLFFVPKSGSKSGGVTAKDALGNDVNKAEWIKSHGAESRELVQGLKGDATYIIVNDAGDDVEYYALNAVCTHLGTASNSSHRTSS